MTLPQVLAGGLLPVNPVVNGGFELSTDVGLDLPEELDTCIGVGHQVFYGSDTLVGRAADGDAEGAAGKATVDDTVEYAGVGHCVYGADDGYDVAWVVPSAMAQRPAVHWSMTEGTPMTFGDFDGDGDREARIVADATKDSHNMWQSYASPHQAWSADFDAFRFRIENGATPVGTVILSLSATPLEAQTPWLVLYFECQLAFRAPLIQSSTDADGVVSIDPALGTFTSRDPACAEAAAAWTGADAQARHDILSRTRIVQLSFWGFHNGASDLILDDVEFVNAKTVAEAAPGARVNPQLGV